MLVNSRDLMPATYQSLGLNFLYPDNWTLAQRDPEDGIEGVTFDLPSGGFLNIERGRRAPSTDELFDEVEQAIVKQYGEVEREEIEDPEGAVQDRVVELRFYYLDLLIVSRLMVIRKGDLKFVIQAQAESRDFEANDMVFAAILKQIRES